MAHDLSKMKRHVASMPGRRYKLADVQEDLEEHLNDLDDLDTVEEMRHRPVETRPDIGIMFLDLVVFKLKIDRRWALDLAQVRIPILRRIKYLAAEYGLYELASIISEHIKLRQTKKTVQKIRNRRAA